MQKKLRAAHSVFSRADRGVGAACKGCVRNSGDRPDLHLHQQAVSRVGGSYEGSRFGSSEVFIILF